MLPLERFLIFPQYELGPTSLNSPSRGQVLRQRVVDARGPLLLLSRQGRHRGRIGRVGQTAIADAAN